MATYKVWLTVKDSFGNIKEIDGGTLGVDLAELTPDEITQIEEALPLEDYIKQDRLTAVLEDYATDEDIDEIKQNTSIKYSELNLKQED